MIKHAFIRNFYTVLFEFIDKMNYTDLSMHIIYEINYTFMVHIIFFNLFI